LNLPIWSAAACCRFKNGSFAESSKSCQEGASKLAHSKGFAPQFKIQQYPASSYVLRQPFQARQNNLVFSEIKPALMKLS
jgi:hypothetical protein